ncbi:MAG: GTP-binding protein [Candidatus Lokiarchaeota archaeon]|nr:GTP-binding protein [Candidatus Lokiarchaeota archaeon]MBD3340582.1 GTP-binding protein [Candidatus Lokiarchaeota archaeon]
MQNNLITALVYTEINDIIGPNPVFWFPQSLSEKARMAIAIKSITMLSTDQGMTPQTLSVVPFPTIKQKGIVKYLEWEDVSQRGEIGRAALTLLFEEADDAIFYKYMSDMESIINNIAQKIIQVEQTKTNRELIQEIIELLRMKVLDFLEMMKKEELGDVNHKAFPRSESTEEINYQFKIIVVGDQSVGKTSLILRFTRNAFRRTYLPSMGINVTDKIIRTHNNNVQLILWDIAGQTKFQSMRTAFYQGAKGVLLIFDLTNPETFESVRKWYNDVRQHIPRQEKLTGYILGNKNDLVGKREISHKDLKMLAQDLNLGFFETSALTGANVKEAFRNLAVNLYAKNR